MKYKERLIYCYERKIKWDTDKRKELEKYLLE